MSNRVRSADVGRASGLVSLILGLAMLAGFAAGPAAAAGCPNEALRIGPSALLPDCRAYEQVSPPDKNGADIALLNEAVAVTGGAITYPSSGAFAGAASNSLLNQYLSRRGPAGWSTEPIVPEYENPGTLLAPEYTGFSADLSYQVLDASMPAPDSHYLYRRNPDGSLTTLNPEAPPSEFLFPPTLFAGASEDFSHILISTHERLTDNAPDTGFNSKLYEWVNGELTLASVAPGDIPMEGSVSGVRPISADGSRLYWQPLAAEGPLYLREGGVSRLISKRQTDDSDATAGFLAASRDGSTAYIRSADRLTADASPVGYDLYRFDADSDEIVNLTPETEGEIGAGVQGAVGASEDGETVYFVAEAALAAGATAGQPNLYVDDGTGTRFIAGLSPEDSGGWLSMPWQRSTQMQVSPDGHTLLFSTAAPIPGYDTSGRPQVYRFELDNGLSCVSCRRDGGPSSGNASLTQAAASIGVNVQYHFPVNNIAAGGARVFFETTEALLSTDTNGRRDVYQWMEQGSGECQAVGGCHYLISTGRSGDNSTFEGASHSGEDVFILTRERLVGQDRDDNIDVYDVRAGGGLVGQNPAVPPLPCSGDSCRAPAPPPGIAPPIGSAAFVGPPTPKGKRKAHKPKRCKHRKRGKNGKRAGKCKRVNKEAK
jgi:hypothetical protein